MLKPTNSVSLRHLRVFAELARQGSFRACARRLHLSPSALSECIKQLEGALGLRLFDRSTRRVALTEAGAAFLVDAKEVLALLDSAVQRCRDVTALRRGKLSIAAIPSLHAALVVPVLAEFVAQHPQITVELIEARGHVLAQKVREGEADLGLGGAATAPTGLALQPLLLDRLGVMAANDHPLATVKRLTWRALAGHRFVTLVDDSVTQGLIATVEAAPAALLQPQFVAGSTPLLAQWVERGFAVSVLSAISQRHPSLAGLAFRPLFNPTVERTLYLHRRSDSSLSPVAARFAQLLVERLPGHVRSGPGLRLAPGPARP